MQPQSQTIQKLFRQLLRPPPQPVLLGRWKLDYSEETLEKTIERANEDHCGTCVNPPKEPSITPEKHS